MRALAPLFALFCSTPAWAYFQMDLLNGKNAAAREATQWTLSDWLTQKNRMNAWDQWLAVHHQVQWLEFNPSGAYQSYERTSTTAGAPDSSSEREGQAYAVDIFIGLLSLAGDYQKTSDNEESFGGAAGLRLFGLSAQSTSLVGRYGWTKLHALKTGEVWENKYAEAELQLYIVKGFGLDGTYRYYFPQTSNQGTRLQAVAGRAGLFFEFGALRIFAQFLQTRMELSKNGMASPGIVTKDGRDGYQAGIKLFF